MVRYLLVRHAEAESQDPDARLTPRGRAQAAALAARLRHERFDVAWSSDLARALETARAILLLHDREGEAPAEPRSRDGLNDAGPGGDGPPVRRAGSCAPPPGGCVAPALTQTLSQGERDQPGEREGEAPAEPRPRSGYGCTTEGTERTGGHEARGGNSLPLSLRVSRALREVGAPSGLDPTLDPAGYHEWERAALTTLTDRLSEWLPEASREAGPGRPETAAPTGTPESVAGAGRDAALARVTLPTPAPAQQGSNAAESDGWIDGDAPILVVSHGGPLRVLLCLLLGLPAERHWSFHLDCAGLTIVERGGELATLTLLNDCCHLEGIGDR